MRTTAPTFAVLYPGDRARHLLDAMLQHVAKRGVFVSAHPETILRMGTKDVRVPMAAT